MYLKIIYQLQQSGDPARVGQMAQGLGVHPSAVSAVVRTLDRMGLITHDRYGVVKLTELGHTLAECVARRFDVLRRFFTAVLGMDPETAEVEACETEHAISPETVARIEHLISALPPLGYVAPVTVTMRESVMCGECVIAGECTAANAVINPPR
jgi:DtxR family Mn-dependent transcriptional regulator